MLLHNYNAKKILLSVNNKQTQTEIQKQKNDYFSNEDQIRTITTVKQQEISDLNMTSINLPEGMI